MKPFVCLLLLHAIAAAPLPFEGAAWLQGWLRLSADLAVLLTLTCALAALRVRGATVVLAVCTALIPLYRFGETLMPTFYGKPFEPWVDLLELPGLFHLLTHEHTTTVQVLMYAGGLAVLLAILWLLAWLWRPWLAIASQPRRAWALALTAQLALFGNFVTGELKGSAYRPSMYAAALDDLRATLATPRWHGEAVVNERVAAARAELASLPANLDGLGGADVFVLVVESYGRTLLFGADAPIAADLHAHQTALAAAGWHAASGWLAPSVRGGGSSLAHAELLSGIAVEDRRVFDHLLASNVRTLASVARDAGYHTVDVQPAMPREWPEAKSLGFTQDLFHHAFAYDGLAYPWGRMPDQFALRRVLVDVVKPDAPPLFVQYVGVSSHAPFHMLPPYLPDWTRASDTHEFAKPDASWDITWTNYLDHPQVLDAYRASIRYALRVNFGFATQLRRPALVVVVGDHQPPLPSVDRLDRLYDVPLHVLSNRADLVEPWLQKGLRAGLLPDPDGASFRGARFLFRFLLAYGR